MRRSVLTWAWLAACTVAMLTPGSSLPDVSVFRFQDKLLHFFLFFVLTYLAVGLGIKEKRGLRGNTRFWINFALFALLPSVVLETAQHLIPYRSFDLKDLLFNALGVFSGLFGYLYRPTCKFILD